METVLLQQYNKEIPNWVGFAGIFPQHGLACYSCPKNKYSHTQRPAGITQKGIKTMWINTIMNSLCGQEYFLSAQVNI